MQIVTERKNVALSGEVQSREFTMKAGAHLMSVLSGLYNDPVDAVVREYLTNMYDAYAPLLKAGVPITPPILRVPSVMSPTLEFQDFGVGMDFDTVWRVYAEYGNSTKSDSNDEVGGFGLGSKTAFCYNEGAPWNIISTKNGHTHRFMAFVNEQGVPTLTHLVSEETGLPNGVTVSIPIRAGDMQSVTEAAKRYLRYFPMQITVEGIPLSDIPTLDYVLAGDGWGVRPRRENYNRTSAQVVMGNVPYTIDNLFNWATINGSVSLTFLNENNVDVFVPIGAVDIVPSRDSLKLTERTKSAVKAAVQEMVDELPSAVQRATAHCKTGWERVQEAESILKNIRLPIAVEQMLDRALSIPVTPTVSKVTMYAITDTGRSTPEVAEGVTEFRFSAVRYNKVLTSMVIVNDTSKSAAALARGYIRKHFVKMNYQGTAAARYGHTRCKVYVVTLANGCSVQDFTKTLEGFDNIVLASALTTSVPVNRAPRSSKSIPVYRYNLWKFEPNAHVLPNHSTYYYLPLKKDINEPRYTWGVGKGGPEFFQQAAKLFGLTVDTVYGIRGSDVKSLGAEWVNIHDEVVRLATKWIDENQEVCSTLLVDDDTNSYSKFILRVIPSSYRPALTASPRNTMIENHTFRSLLLEPTDHFTTEGYATIIAARKRVPHLTAREQIAQEFVERAGNAVQFAYKVWCETKFQRAQMETTMLLAFENMGLDICSTSK